MPLLATSNETLPHQSFLQYLSISRTFIELFQTQTVAEHSAAPPSCRSSPCIWSSGCPISSPPGQVWSCPPGPSFSQCPCRNTGRFNNSALWLVWKLPDPPEAPWAPGAFRAARTLPPCRLGAVPPASEQRLVGGTKLNQSSGVVIGHCTITMTHTPGLVSDTSAGVWSTCVTFKTNHLKKNI